MRFEVLRSIEIKKPIEDVRETITNFNTWRSCSPWLCLEKNAALEIIPDGKSYSWEGERSVSGSMSQTALEPNELNFDLRFIKPFKSQAKISFSLHQTGKNTAVDWKMLGSLPFFMLPMRKPIINMIAMGFERGFKMLKNLLEQGQVNSTMSDPARVPFETLKYFGASAHEFSVNQMESKMTQCFQKASVLLKKHEVSDVIVLSLYNKFDMNRNTFSFTAGFGFKRQIPVKLLEAIDEDASLTRGVIEKQ